MVTDPILDQLGRTLRSHRERAGLGVSELARRAGVSRRYLTDVERGRANVTILKLASLASALRVPLADLCDIPSRGPSVRRVALVGLRGAGKSTIGRRLALDLELPFVELDQLIEERSGMRLADSFSMHGEAWYRKLEREALEAWLERSGSGVLATGGSIVTHPESWQRLLETCRVVWLRAEPDDHWKRVIEQGDTRPMASHPRAREELREILADREPLYERSHLIVDTSRTGIRGAVESVRAAVERDRWPGLEAARS